MSRRRRYPTSGLPVPLNQALHRTSAGEVKGPIRIGGAVASKSYDELLPPGSALRKLAFEYYREDFEMLASLEIPPFDNARYKQDLARQGGRYTEGALEGGVSRLAII